MTRRTTDFDKNEHGVRALFVANVKYKYLPSKRKIVFSYNYKILEWHARNISFECNYGEIQRDKRNFRD